MEFLEYKILGNITNNHKLLEQNFILDFEIFLSPIESIGFKYFKFSNKLFVGSEMKNNINLLKSMPEVSEAGGGNIW